jgi:hypothetical protein
MFSYDFSTKLLSGVHFAHGSKQNYDYRINLMYIKSYILILYKQLINNATEGNNYQYVVIYHW